MASRVKADLYDDSINLYHRGFTKISVMLPIRYHSPTAHTRRIYSAPYNTISSTDEKVFFTAIDHWANEPVYGEQRQTAATRIKNAYKFKEFNLYLSALGLSTLPDLSSLTQLGNLIVTNNRLSEWPNLGALHELRNLNIANNRFIALPDLSKLTHLRQLNLSHNAFTTLPDLAVLTGLLALELAHNRLTTLPDLSKLTNLYCLNVTGNLLNTLPDLSTLSKLSNLSLTHNHLTTLQDLSNLRCLSRLHLCHNHFTHISETLLRLPQNCEIDLSHNFLSETVIQQIQTTSLTPGYRGPRIHFAMAHPSAHPMLVRPLHEAVADWYQQDTNNAFTSLVRNTWRMISDSHDLNSQENIITLISLHAVSVHNTAKDFSLFLDRLRHTINFTESTFRTNVTAWLTRLGNDTALREQIFLIAQDGLGSCEDRVSLTFNTMKQRELTLNVERGHYDNALDQLITLARQQYRLDQLEKIAHEKISTLRFVDEIEVYLAYQVKLRKNLALPIDTARMRFFGVAGITQDDLDIAELSIKQTEDRTFPYYLACDWSPWQSVLKRLAPRQYQLTQDHISQAASNEFEARQKDFFQAEHLDDNEFNRATTAEKVLRSIAIEFKYAFTQSFLIERNLHTLLHSFWNS